MNALDLQCIILYVATMEHVEPSQMVVSCQDGWEWSIEVNNKMITWDRDYIVDFEKFVKYYEKEYLNID